MKRTTRSSNQNLTSQSTKKAKMTTNAGSAHAWADLPSVLSSALSKVNDAASADGQLKAFTASDAINDPATFGIKAAGSDNTVLVTVDNGKASVHSGNASQAEFVLSALPEQWEQFFKQTPVAPYQSKHTTVAHVVW